MSFSSTCNLGKLQHDQVITRFVMFGLSLVLSNGSSWLRSLWTSLLLLRLSKGIVDANGINSHDVGGWNSYPLQRFRPSPCRLDDIRHSTRPETWQGFGMNSQLCKWRSDATSNMIDG